MDGKRENIDVNISPFAKTDDSMDAECEETSNISDSIILSHKTSMKNNFIRINLKIDENVVEHPAHYLDRNKEKIICAVNSLLTNVFSGLVKINIKFSIKMKKWCEDGEMNIYEDIYITSEPKQINVKDEGISDEILSSIVDNVDEKFACNLCEGSGWIIDSIQECVVMAASLHRTMWKRKKNICWNMVCYSCWF